MGPLAGCIVLAVNGSEAASDDFEVDKVIVEEGARQS